MRIMFDMDGVLASFTANVIEVANSIWPGKLPLDYVPSNWDYTDVFTKDEWNQVWDTIHNIPDFWLREPPIPESVKALKEFRITNKSPIWFVTSRMKTGGVAAKYQTELWLLKHGLIRLSDTSKVIAVNKPEEKLKIVEDLQIEVSIDDYAPTVERHNKVVGHTAYLLDQPWNQGVNVGPRVYSVKEFLETIS